MNPLRLVFVEPKGGGKIQDGVTVTPTKEEQTVEPDSGFDGLGAVTVEAIPDAYQDVTGVNAGAEDIRVGKIGIDSHGNLLNGDMLPRKSEQEKSVVPTKQAQTVSPDSGHALSAVNVAKIPDAYQDVSFVDNEAADIRIGKTGVSATGERLDGQMLPRKPEQSKTVTPTKSSQLIEPDSGYALSAVEVDAIPDEYADVSGVTADANVVKQGYTFVDSEGVETHGTNTDDADTSDGTMIASQLEADAVGYSQGQRIVGTMPVRSADVEISDLSPVAIPAGSYDGTAAAKLSSAAASEVVAANIRQGAEILGVQGSYQGADTLEQYFANTLTSVNDTHATGIPGAMFRGKSALVSATFQELTATGTYDFADCSNLESFDAPALTNIGNYSFGNDGKLSSINMPSVTKFNAGCFQDCGLTVADFPLVTQSGGSVFNRCSKLTSVNLPLLTTAGTVFIGSCPLLETVDFPVLTSIQASFFEHCRTLNVVVLRKSDSVCTLSNINAFLDTPFASNGTGGTLYVPQAQIANYQSATNWSVILAYTNNQILPIEGSPYEVTS